ncbi:MAG: malonic semialdehyde reductase [Methanobacterium sp. PtaB.Bin024]|jgi:nitroreductase|nr:MAG: malonic semialdehyde reductase [Methanobacterium sp. PtaB.Bin024]
MEFEDLIQERYSVRSYQSRPVEDEKLEAVLDAARLAPTAANKQPFRLIVVKTEGKKDQMKRIYHGDWFSEAPLVICACSVKSESWTRRDGRNYVDVDVTIAMDHLILQATELGLGTCWIAAFDAEAAREILKIPEGVEPLLFTPLGYPADEIGPKSRKELDELVHYEEW